MVMALRGILGQKVFLTIGAGGYLHLEPEQWRPIIEAASPDVRGVMMVSPYDLDRIGKSLDVILPMLADRGIAYQFVEYEADGHVFPCLLYTSNREHDPNGDTISTNFVFDRTGRAIWHP